MNGSASFNAQNNTVTFTPTAGYTGPASFTYAISDGRGGTASANVNLTVTAPGQTATSLFTSASMPTQTALNDGQQIEVGMKFQSSVAGQITALKFYRSAGDTGTDLLDLWSATGTKLASVTFNNTDRQRLADGDLADPGHHRCRTRPTSPPTTRPAPTSQRTTASPPPSPTGR